MVSVSSAERVSLKDVAQPTWAFIGNPGEAKDRLKGIVESKGKPDGAYDKVFFEGVDARYLALPWKAYRMGLMEWNQY